MKKYIFSIAMLLSVFSLMAQSPSLFNFQGVARDGQNQVLSNQNIGLKISILQGSSTGNIVYAEEHSISTSDLGVFALKIGSGSNQTGQISSTTWSQGGYWVEVQLDDSGGTNYQVIGSSQLVSVPYAMHAETVANADDADADPNNELQTISKIGKTITLSSGGGSFEDEVNDADADATNELQTLGFDVSNNILSLSNGGQVDLSALDNDGGGTGSGTDDQVLSISGTNLSIEDGNSVDLSVLQDGTQDADADPNNEIQTISKSGKTISLSQSGGTFVDEVDDADADPNNELQTITKNGSTITLSNNGGSFTDAVNDADSDEFNEIQFISKNGNTVELSLGGGVFIDEVDDADADPNNELQTISKNGNTVTLSNNGGTFTDATEDGDADATNEIQNLSLQNDILSLSQSNTQVDLGALSSPWKRVPQSNIIEFAEDAPLVRIEDTNGSKIEMESNILNIKSLNGNRTLLGDHFLSFNKETEIAQDIILTEFITTLDEDSLSFGYRVKDGLQSGYASFSRDELSMKNQVGGQSNVSSFSPYNLQIEQALGDFKTKMSLQHDNIEFINVNPGNYVNTKVGFDSIYMTSQIGLLFPETAVLKPFELTFNNLITESHLTSNGLIVKEAISASDKFNRIELVPDFFTMYNEAKWKTSALGKNPFNQSGELSLYDGTGDRIHSYIGADDQGRSFMELNAGTDLRVGLWSFDNYGLLNTMGGNGFQNTYIGTATLHNNKNFGGMGVMDDFGIPKAYMEVSGNGTGLVYSDAIHIGSTTKLNTNYALNVVQTPNYGVNFYNNDFSSQWELFINAGGSFGLWHKGINVGSFDPVTGAYINFSDRSLKSDIKNIGMVLTKVKMLNPSSYKVKNNNPGNRESMGFIAQDVKKLFPELVTESMDARNKGLLSLDYSGFSVIAIKAIQEQQEIIEGQQTKIKNLEGRLEKLEALLLSK